MYTNNELLFPNYVIPMLRDQRGDEWRDLVDSVKDRSSDDPHLMGFVLMMIRLNGCLDCETDSYRAMRGCAMCATQTLRRYKGSDKDLLELYEKALADVKTWLDAREKDDLRIA